ncbi:acyl carrier protein [Hymenobacter metallilatus]|uniref:acyl carrier protein n=1 Tax=Hymenobacter metallilatus TaxID=2493666 RepID=UPI00163A1366|nr:acyl carrier protein [Hymenobacter metallilatus]
MENWYEITLDLCRRQAWYLSGPTLEPTTHLVHDLGFDSLDCLQLTIRLERGLGIEIPDQETQQWQTLAHVLASVERQLFPAPASSPVTSTSTSPAHDNQSGLSCRA